MSNRLSLVVSFALAAQILQASPADDTYLRQKLAQAIDPRAAPTPIPTQPLGDEHVAGLAEELDDLSTAGIFWKRCIDQDRTNAEVLNAANVLADCYDEVCVHMAQFYLSYKIWKKSGGNTADFSITAQNRLNELSIRINTVMKDSMDGIGDALGKKPRHSHDPALVAVVQRMVASRDSLKTFQTQADKQ